MFDFSTAQLPFLNKKGNEPASDKEALNQDTIVVESTSQLPWYRRLKRWQLGLIACSIIFITALATIGIYTYIVVDDLLMQAQTARITGVEAYTAFKGQNLPETKNKLQELDS